MASMEILIGSHKDCGDKLRNVIDLVDRALLAGPVLIELGRPKRSGAQNSHFHALIGEIAQKVTPGGQRFSPEVWKALCAEQFAKDMEEAGEPLSKPEKTVTSLDGRREITVRPSTTGLKKKEAADFIEWLYAFGVEHGVTFTAPVMEIYEQYRESK